MRIALLIALVAVLHLNSNAQADSVKLDDYLCVDTCLTYEPHELFRMCERLFPDDIPYSAMGIDAFYDQIRRTLSAVVNERLDNADSLRAALTEVHKQVCDAITCGVLGGTLYGHHKSRLLAYVEWYLLIGEANDFEVSVPVTDEEIHDAIKSTAGSFELNPDEDCMPNIDPDYPDYREWLRDCAEWLAMKY